MGGFQPRETMVPAVASALSSECSAASSGRKVLGVVHYGIVRLQGALDCKGDIDSVLQ